MTEVPKEKCCSFSGHRVIPKAHEKAIYEYTSGTVERMIAYGFTDFYTGGADGFDTLAAKVVCEMKQKYEGIKLHMLLPYRCLDSGAVKKYAYMDMADSIEYSAEKYSTSGTECLFDRNRKLADCCSVMLAYLTKNDGGTAYTVQYAKGSGVKLKNMAHFPKD